MLGLDFFLHEAPHRESRNMSCSSSNSRLLIAFRPCMPALFALEHPLCAFSKNACHTLCTIVTATQRVCCIGASTSNVLGPGAARLHAALLFLWRPPTGARVRQSKPPRPRDVGQPASSAGTTLLVRPELQATLGRDTMRFGFDAELERPPVAELVHKQPVETTVRDQRNGRKRRQAGTRCPPMTIRSQASAYRHADTRGRSADGGNDRLAPCWR